MNGEIYDRPNRILVTSETEGDKAAYLVDLCSFDVNRWSLQPKLYNGECQCKDFMYRCLPKLKDPANQGKIYRCKHLHHARAICLDLILPYLAASDPNHASDQHL